MNGVRVGLLQWDRDTRPPKEKLPAIVRDFAHRMVFGYPESFLCRWFCNCRKTALTNGKDISNGEMPLNDNRG